MSKKDRKLKNILIYPKFQFALILSNLMIFLICSAMVGLQLVKYTRYLHDFGASINLPKDHFYFQVIETQSHDLGLYMLGAFIGSFILSAVASLFVSHLLVGPIVRLKNYFRNIRETGKVQSKLSFRKGDFFSELPQEINEALEKLK